MEQVEQFVTSQLYVFGVGGVVVVIMGVAIWYLAGLYRVERERCAAMAKEVIDSRIETATAISNFTTALALINQSLTDLKNK